MIENIPETWFCKSYEEYKLFIDSNINNRTSASSDSLHEKIKQLEHRMNVIEQLIKNTRTTTQTIERKNK